MRAFLVVPCSFRSVSAIATLSGINGVIDDARKNSLRNDAGESPYVGSTQERYRPLEATLPTDNTAREAYKECN